MRRILLATLAIIVAAPAMSAPPRALSAAVAKWAAPRSVERFHYSMTDLNADKTADAVVHVTDPGFCGNGGCPLLVFKGTAKGYELVANSGYARKPMYVLKETHYGWHTLAAIVGFGVHAGVVPIRYRGTEYNSRPYERSSIELESHIHEHVLNFEAAP